MKINKNVGQLDRIIRMGLAMIFLILGFIVSAWFYLLAIIMIVTALTKYCSIYSLLKINTLENRFKKN